MSSLERGEMVSRVSSRFFFLFFLFSFFPLPATKMVIFLFLGGSTQRTACLSMDNVDEGKRRPL